MERFEVCNISPAQNTPVLCFRIQNKDHTLLVYEIPWNLNLLQIPSLSLSWSIQNTMSSVLS